MNWVEIYEFIIEVSNKNGMLIVMAEKRNGWLRKNLYIKKDREEMQQNRDMMR